MAEARGQNRERWTYDVFVSFRGLDVRRTFISFLYKSFVSSGIYTFKDDEGLERGKSITTSLLNAIASSKVYVVVLSTNYAASYWCLNELEDMMKCFGSSSGHVVIPIFLYVDPSDVRRQKGSFGKGFHRHKNRQSTSRLQRWKEALVQVANISGFFTIEDRSEENLIEDVTRNILKILPSSYLNLPIYGVGITSRVHRIYELMCFGSDDVKTIGICGMGGIGKTTLAKAAYNEFSDRFEGTCFLENFGEYFKRPEGKVILQRKLLSDILRKDNMVFNNTDDAVKQRFRNIRVLVVIDNVEDLRQLDKVGIEDFNCFGPGSRVLITSRDKQVFEYLRIQNICSPEELDDGESLELVCRHAFRTVEPPEEFLELTKKLVEYCGGLPLAMEVLGAFLCNKKTSQWKNTLKKLKRNPDNRIQASLRISFDGLDPLYKRVFLDIACFFTEMDKDYVGSVLDAFNLHSDTGLSVLMEKCLITVRDNKLMMHDLLRDMGRDIVQEASPNSRGKRSRLWDRDDVLDVLTKNSGTEEIEGLSLKAEITDPTDFEAKALSKMVELRLLQLSHVQVKGSYEHFPKGLQWLCWLGYPLDSVPINLHLSCLVVMDLQYSNLKRLFGAQEVEEGSQESQIMNKLKYLLKRLSGVQEKPQTMNKLKYLDLSHSVQLTETPNFSHLPNLEKLLLINCERLVLVHKSIEILHEKLVLLNLNGCTMLSDLPIEIYKLKSLETLILSGCTQLKRLDDALGELESLTTLRADFTALRYIPFSINQLKKLQELSLNGCTELWKDGESTPPSLKGLNCLKTLRLGSCNLSDELVPEGIGSLPCLEELDLQGNLFQNLQIDFSIDLKLLKVIRLDRCSELQSIRSSLPESLMTFSASNCIKLEKTPDLSGCSNLQSLHLTNCFNLTETPGLDKLETVGVIHMEMCNRISDTYRERITQDTDGGIFIPGCSLPTRVRFKNESHSVSFNVPGTLSCVPVGFTLWTLYESKKDDNVMSKFSPKITVKNQTNGTVWSRKSATDNIRLYVEKHIWQRHFSNLDYFFKTGDQLEVSVDFGDEVTILEIGLTPAYRE